MDIQDVKENITTHSLESGENNKSDSGSGLQMHHLKDQIVPCSPNEVTKVVVDKEAVIERGLLESYEPLNISLVFTSTPMWLLTLDHHMVKTLTFVKFDSLTNLKSYLNSKTNGRLFIAIIEEIGYHKCRFSNQSNGCDLVLMNGTLEDSYDWTLPFKSPTLFVSDHSFKIRKRKWRDFPVHFMRLSHNSVGGATTREIL